MESLFFAYLSHFSSIFGHNKRMHLLIHPSTYFISFNFLLFLHDTLMALLRNIV